MTRRLLLLCCVLLANVAQGNDRTNTLFRAVVHRDAATTDVNSSPEEPTANPETVLVTYRFAPQNEAALRKAIQHHWTVVRRLNLVTGQHQLFRADASFIEIFTWRDAAIPDAPPAEVSAIWTEMERLADKRGSKSGINFEAVQRVDLEE